MRNADPPSRIAMNMPAYRKRKKRGQRVFPIRLDNHELDQLRDLGYLCDGVTPAQAVEAYINDKLAADIELS